MIEELLYTAIGFFIGYAVAQFRGGNKIPGI